MKRSSYAALRVGVTLFFREKLPASSPPAGGGSRRSRQSVRQFFVGVP
jgi:hypothetical protein